MYDSGPPGNTNSFFPEMNDYFINGKATFAMNYFAFLPALANQGTNPNYYDKVGVLLESAGAVRAAVRLAGRAGHEHQQLHQR